MDTKQISDRVERAISELLAIRKVLQMKDEEAVAPRKALKLVESGICLGCGKSLEGMPQTRGRHRHCYRRIYNAMQKGEITDDQAVAEGKLLPPDTGGRRRIEDVELDDIVENMANEIQNVADQKKKTAKKGKTKSG